MGMKEFYEMNVKELCELAHEKQVQIELRIEPDGYGKENNTNRIVRMVSRLSM